jgi:hypothetical protein
MSEAQPKKRGRRKKIIEVVEPVPEKPEKKTKRQKKEVKIINAIASTEMIHQSKAANVILHLKCTLREIEDCFQRVQWENGNLTYLPDAPTEIQAFEDNQTQQFEVFDKNAPSTITAYHAETGFQCPNCNYTGGKQEENTHVVDQTDVTNKLRELKLKFYRNDMKDKKSACFWCTYPFDNETCYILKHDPLGEIVGHGSFCSPECSVAYLYGSMNWDDSAKIESYQLINYYYGKPNHHQDNIKPAASPYYFLDKFYGNMDIQEYRKMCKSNHMLLTVDKPITRVLPEIHEDSERLTVNNNTQIRGNYKVKRQSDKTTVPNRNNILRDSFGLS